MACCGQKRSQASNPLPTSAPAVTQRNENNRLPMGTAQRVYQKGLMPYATVALRYTESSPVLVRGSATGQQYEFSGITPVQMVDGRDVESLLRTRFFRRT